MTFKSKEEKETNKEEIAYGEGEETEKKKVVVPGDVIVSGQNYLPGEGTIREKENIIATKFGLASINERFVKVIPLSGIYVPRAGNVVIGKIENATSNGWVIDILSPYYGFLPLKECREFISRKDIGTFFNIGDMITAEVLSITPAGVDLTMRGIGLHKLDGGMIIKINSNKVPRVIGKKGSMINLIKNETGCKIVVGQNGLIWIKSDSIESELLAKDAIMLIIEKSYVGGLTEKIKEFLEKHKKDKDKKEKKEEKEGEAGEIQ